LGKSSCWRRTEGVIPHGKLGRTSMKRIYGGHTSQSGSNSTDSLFFTTRVAVVCVAFIRWVSPEPPSKELFLRFKAV
jgi:hypothetical protein